MEVLLLVVSSALSGIILFVGPETKVELKDHHQDNSDTIDVSER